MTDQGASGATRPAKLAEPTLEDLAALNREIAELVRSGLESGLAQIAQDFGGGTGALAARLRDETVAGKSLAEAVEAQGQSLPPVYRAVVAAGIKSNRLAAALEGFAETAARVSDLRRIAAQAAAYPLLVFIVAWVMLLAVIVVLLPRFDWLGIQDRYRATPLRVLEPAALPLAIVVPAALLVSAAIWWRRSASALSAGRAPGWTRWIPGVARARQLSGDATFAELLRLLLSCRVPLVEALPLAGNACGSAHLERSAAELAAALATGHSLAGQPASARALPPLVRAALLGGQSPDGLVVGLDRAAHAYRERAASWIGYYAVMAPVAATLALGGVVTGAYALLVIQPYIASLKELAGWR
jgi:type II secretory pathway component PulF